MIINKILTGRVAQRYDTVLQRFVGQQFEAKDGAVKFEWDGKRVRLADLPADIHVMDLPVEIVQPWNTDLTAAPEAEQVLVTILDAGGTPYTTILWKFTDEENGTVSWCDPESDPQEECPYPVIAWKPRPCPHTPTKESK